MLSYTSSNYWPCLSCHCELQNAMEQSKPGTISKKQGGRSKKSIIQNLNNFQFF